MRFSRCCPLGRALLLALLLPLAAPAAEVARFAVTDRVLAPQVSPFTATIGQIGNGSELIDAGGGFEPAVFRNRYIAIADAPDRVIADPAAVSRFDTLRTGALDGAEVRIYRIEDGVMRIVREDRVAAGGHQASGWLLATPKGRLIAPDRTGFGFRFAAWNQPGVTLHFALQAVGPDGSLSPVSASIAITRPAAPAITPKPEKPKRDRPAREKKDERAAREEKEKSAAREEKEKPAARENKETRAAREREKAAARKDKAGTAPAAEDQSVAEAPDAEDEAGEETARGLIPFNPGKKGRKAPATGPAPAAPTGLAGVLAPDGSVSFTWDAAPDPGIAGYRLLRSDSDPATHQGYFLGLEGGADKVPVKAGDMAILSKKVYRPSRAALHSSRVWGAEKELRVFKPQLIPFWPDEGTGQDWQFAPHPPGTPVAEPGETFLDLDLAAGGTAIGLYTHAGPEQDWYPVLEPRPYRIAVWLRADQPSRVVFRVGGYGRDLPDIGFDVGPDWALYQAEFIPPPPPARMKPQRMELVFEGPGRYGIDNFRVWRADAPWLGLMPEDRDRLARAALSALRTHAFIKTGVRTHDMAQLTSPGGVIASGTNTLPQSLALMREAGVEPWLQIEPHMSPAEWLGLAEWLAAPADPGGNLPWAAKRVAQGQARPWVEAFPHIRLEIGNETWNGIFAPWIFGEMTDAVTGRRYKAGEVYGLFQEHVIAVLKTSPWWDRLEPKLTFVLGGWNGKDYGAMAARMSPGSAELTIAAYNGGWDEKEGPPDGSPASFATVLAQVAQVAIPRASRHAAEVAEIGAEQGRVLRLGTYEAGPGYALNGLNNARVSREAAAAQEKVMKSLAAGTATLDAFLARAALGFGVQNYFTYGSGTNWTSHARWNRGGQEHPGFALIGLFNRLGTGDLLAVETLSVPTIDLPEAKRRAAVTDAPLVGAYATRSGDRVTVFLVSRRVPDWPVAGEDGVTEVELALPFAGAARLTRWRLTGGLFAETTTGPDVRLVFEPVPVPGDLTRFRPEGGLPPGETLVYVFEGVR